MEKKDIFKEFDIDINSLHDRLSNIYKDNNKKEYSDLSIIRDMVKELSSIEIATLLRIQTKALRELSNRLNGITKYNFNNDIAFV